MQFFLSSLTLALVACAAVDSASKSVSKRDLWQSGAVQDHPGFMGQSGYSGYSGHSGLGVQQYGNGWSQGIEARIHMPEAYQYGHVQAPVHPVHEHPEEESQDKMNFQEWKPVYSDLKHHATAGTTKNSEQEQHSHEEWQDDEDKHEEPGKHHHHHHHHHVKVIEVPKPYTVHVEKPFPVYVEKPIIVEKHVPLKLLIKKKYH
ncbi:uncharacterized protein LOC135712807 [Ochlerotatus camptorhynchus]|uniref:uncharacterized protein LOC135712807 n=1 Tax=Ochlerotatus camptorhynchus TaxID=644619 RepID=UPI0031D44D68